MPIHDLGAHPSTAELIGEHEPGWTGADDQDISIQQSLLRNTKAGSGPSDTNVLMRLIRKDGYPRVSATR
jgi:hypothetical protein